MKKGAIVKEDDRKTNPGTFARARVNHLRAHLWLALVLHDTVHMVSMMM